MDRLLSIIGNLTELSVKDGVKGADVARLSDSGCDCCCYSQLAAGQLHVVCMHTQTAMGFVFVAGLGSCLPGRKLTVANPLLSDKLGNWSHDQMGVR
jgi:hypothetical protein